MRDPNRIDGVLNTIKQCWSKYPDWRFMQAICNFQKAIGQDGFYLEDDKFEKAFKEFFEVEEE